MAAEMQRQHLAGLQIDHGRAGVAPERRAVVGRRGDHLAEAGRRRAALQFARLQALDSVSAAEELVLDRHRVASVERRVADDEDLATGEVAGILQRQAQRLVSRRQAIDPDDRHVPVRVDHHDLTHPQCRTGGPIEFPPEIDAGGAAVEEAEAAIAETTREHRRHVAVGHDQTVTDDEAGAGVGTIGQTIEVDPTHARDDGFDALPDRRIVRKPGPQVVGHSEGPVDDIDRRPQIGKNDRFQTIVLRVRRGVLQRQGLQALARHLHRIFPWADALEGDTSGARRPLHRLGLLDHPIQAAVTAADHGQIVP
jgi:hypothetical protein